ncbi:MAG: sigma-54-dependent Fis family transcriptional regulator, partial [Geobacteraceae bacterium]|nr:sigma-54-dependent Fis family transcriptional regulator [Geobacteraceae bacterium]
MARSTHPVPTLPILLVDDEDHVLDVTRMTLCSKGISNIITLNDSQKVISLLNVEKQPV